MKRAAYAILNPLFHGFHAVVIAFTVFGWWVPQLRLFHLLFILATLACWYIVGLWLGLGWCPVTDLHWRIKAVLGEGRPQVTYIHFVISRLGLGWAASRVDRVVLATTLAVTALSIGLNVWSCLPPGSRAG